MTALVGAGGTANADDRYHGGYRQPQPQPGYHGQSHGPYHGSHGPYVRPYPYPYVAPYRPSGCYPYRYAAPYSPGLSFGVYRPGVAVQFGINP